MALVQAVFYIYLFYQHYETKRETATETVVEGINFRTWFQTWMPVDQDQFRM